MESAPRKRRANDVISITPLGSGREVGRSAIVVKFKGKQVMLDCGVHPGKSGQDSLPFFDECDPAEIDLVLITHFHDDHCGALPYFTEKTNFKGKVFMTPPTRAVFKIFLTDHLRISGQQGMSQPLFDQKDLTACLSKIESIDFQQEKEYKGIRFCAYSAGHVLGAAMFMVEIANVRTLYSGDFSHEEDRHLMPAEVPPEKPDVFICESTYGTGEHPPRVERENIFTSNIRKVVSRGGRCLVPVFALGRAQELLLILDEYWRVNEELQNIPIYYTGATASRALRVYQTYINMMNENIKGRMSIGNPFQFQYVHNLNSLDDFEDDGPSVVIASPAMLQNGLSRQLFERWCSNSNNGVVLTGYCVKETLASDLQTGASREFTALDGRQREVHCSVDTISFSAHADFKGTQGFLEKTKPKGCIILVHGEYKNMMTPMKEALENIHNNLPEEERPLAGIKTPANGQSVELEFDPEKTASVIGSLASKKPKTDEELAGVWVNNNGQVQIMSKEDLTDFTELVPSTLIQYLNVPFHCAPKALERALQREFDSVDWLKGEMIVMETVKLSFQTSSLMLLNWVSGAVPDMIVDTIVATALRVEAQAVAMTTCLSMDDLDDSSEAEMQVIYCLLTQHFENVQIVEGKRELVVKYDKFVANINLDTCDILCSDLSLRKRIQQLLKQAQLSVLPLDCPQSLENSFKGLVDNA